jgi:hypothetical protein
MGAVGAAGRPSRNTSKLHPETICAAFATF